MIFPSDLKYSQDHSWVRVDEDRATVGITDFAQSWIGNLINIDIFEDGSVIEPLGLFGILETSKVSFELYSPIGGTVIKRNDKLLDQITLINQEPYEGGWMIVLRMRDIQDLANLMDANAYKKYIKNWGDLEGSDE
ncbi:MAG: glycine cleavage system protein H [Deltaproteobacteria bacterium RBG_16_47_11]|nr:MAG: glycine cleavage system protein H [Deltaproteobacteria bacterium RBG_16_47_11]